MAVTNYHTVNGMIIGETTSGTRRAYLPDALGSVVATVDDTAALQNTYRYKPFGTVIAKTGIGADPKYLWTGIRQRRTATANLLYPRGNHDETSSGTDLRSNPFSARVAPLTLVCGEYSNSRKVDDKTCGQASWKIFFDIKGGQNGYRGVVVQEVLSLTCYHSCPGKPKRPATVCNANLVLLFNCYLENFWEGWPFTIRNGKADFDGPNGIGSGDLWNQGDQGECTGGVATVSGFAQIVDRTTFDTWNFSVNPALLCNPFGPTSLVRPRGWNRSANGSLVRRMSVLHQCCCVPDRCPTGARVATSAAFSAKPTCRKLS